MIITCERCQTKYRFDDSLVTGEGVWVRCTRCRHVFFQENPLKAEPSPPTPPLPPKEEEEILSRLEETEETSPFEEIEKEKQEEPASVAKKRTSIGRVLAYIFAFLLVLILACGTYLWVSPDGRKQVVVSLIPYFPPLERWANDWLPKESAISEISLQDLRQHFVNNWLLGQLRVVEGTAVNTSKYPLTKIQVRGRMYDAAGVVLGETLSYCGNFLTDAELATMMEEEIKTKLLQPPGGGTNDRLNPHGQIPFMLVFIHDLPTVSKVTVAPAGAERLLE